MKQMKDDIYGIFVAAGFSLRKQERTLKGAATLYIRSIFEWIKKQIPLS